ncbi:MAG: hypothetical protein CBC48_16110 [bacterium TMED88]|nr:hypothetical protein [Deltaproteobacteria bacterium]OUV25693.1 MAG: hypothetical protein CBC48_16110 [bacterium TMED88]
MRLGFAAPSCAFSACIQPLLQAFEFATELAVGNQVVGRALVNKQPCPRIVHNGCVLASYTRGFQLKSIEHAHEFAPSVDALHFKATKNDGFNLSHRGLL